MKSNDLIIIKATITMKPTEVGGRKSGFISGYRPNHVFELPENLRDLRTYIGDIIFDDVELFEPGETKIVTVRFLKTPLIEKYINVGQKWFINEASRTLGYGEIIEI
jgi:translation elongation factor EF-Tu-like GTPase